MAKNTPVVPPVAPAVVVSAAMQKVIDAARFQAAQPTKGKRGKAPRLCACGCTRLTKGGTFYPGDDSKFKSRMMKHMREGKSDAEATVLAVAEGAPVAK